jgi:hypothetical protein
VPGILVEMGLRARVFQCAGWQDLQTRFEIYADRDGHHPDHGAVTHWFDRCPQGKIGLTGIGTHIAPFPLEQADPEARMNTDLQDRHRPLSNLVADLWRESVELVREEAALAKAELVEKGTRAGFGVMWIAAGGAVLLAGAIFLLVAGVAGLAMFLPEDHAAWLAPLIVAAAVVPPGLLLVIKGCRSFASENLKPSQSVRSVRKDVEVIKEHM